MGEKYLISGNFLGKNIVGLTRKAFQYLIQIDQLENADQIYVAVPEDLAEFCPNLKRVKMLKAAKSCDGWNTKVAIKMAKKYGCVYVNFTSPFTIRKQSIVSIDDVRYMEKNQGEYFDSLKFRIKMFIRARIGTLVADKIVTVSEFSKERIEYFFNVNPNKIFVIPNGWEHILSIEEDNRIIQKYEKLNGREFFFTLGSLAKHKNHKLIMNMAANNPEKLFVIGGGIDPEIWFKGSEQKNTDNLIFTGMLTDGEIKSLMKRCKAFIFPSYYEGFGIPPLEALACGADVVVSDIAVHREIFGDTVRYISPDDENVNLESVLSQNVSKPDRVLEKYSWKVAGEKWYELLKL